MYVCVIYLNIYPVTFSSPVLAGLLFKKARGGALHTAWLGPQGPFLLP